jgi:protein-S-isoprenylcysteine O-methyltransferase Ste14
MALCDELERHGQWLFRWRSYLPLLLVMFFAVALHGYQWPFGTYSEYSAWTKVCLVISLTGFGVRCGTVAVTPAGTSGRNTKLQVAKSLNTTGMYSLVRHPLYLGNFLIGLGISLAPALWWLPVIYCLCFCAYYERIMFAEEAFLHRKFGQEFSDWAARTPAFFPRHLKWRKAELPPSLRNVVRREYTAFAVAILGSAAVQFAEHLVIDHRVVYEAFWVSLIISAGGAYLTLRWLKKRTSLLDAVGR